MRTRPSAFHLALLGSTWAGSNFLIEAGWWPGPLLLGLLLYGIVAVRTGRAEFLHTWLRAGRLDLRTGAAVAVIAAGSGLTLMLWAIFFDPDWDTREDPVPWWVTAVHILFMAWTIFNAHDPELFVAAMLFFLGFATMMASMWMLAAAGVLYLLLDLGVVRPEERYLEDRFGAEYLAYKARVRRWL